MAAAVGDTGFPRRGRAFNTKAVDMINLHVFIRAYSGILALSGSPSDAISRFIPANHDPDSQFPQAFVTTGHLDMSCGQPRARSLARVMQRCREPHGFCISFYSDLNCHVRQAFASFRLSMTGFVAAYERFRNNSAISKAKRTQPFGIEKYVSWAPRCGSNVKHLIAVY